MLAFFWSTSSSPIQIGFQARWCSHNPCPVVVDVCAVLPPCHRLMWLGGENVLQIIQHHEKRSPATGIMMWPSSLSSLHFAYIQQIQAAEELREKHWEVQLLVADKVVVFDPGRSFSGYIFFFVLGQYYLEPRNISLAYSRAEQQMWFLVNQGTKYLF